MKVRLIVMSMVIATAACAKVTVRHVNPAASNEQKLTEEGVFYALPKTVAKVQVKIEKATKTAAPYMMFAPIFAPGADALCDSPKKCAETSNSVAFKLLQGAAFSTVGEPDPGHVYLVKFAGGGTVDQKISMTWTDTGLATTAAATVTNRTVDVVVAGAKLATGLGSKAYLGAEAARLTQEKTACQPPVKASKNDGWIITELAVIGDTNSRAVAFANYCDMKLEVREEYDQARDKERLQGAVRAFEIRVADYAKNRFNILTGEANFLDPGAMVDRLDAIIDKELKALFLGATKKETWEPVFEVRELSLSAAEELLQLDAANGPCPRKNKLAYDAKPMPAGFATEALNCTATHSKVIVEAALFPKTGQLFETVTAGVSQPKDTDERSFRYRIPAQVVATLKEGDKDFGSGVFSVAQFGRVASLPAKRASKELAYELGFVEATGGLKSFKLGSIGNVDAQTMNALSEAGGTVLDARSKQRAEDEKAAKAAETAADELTLITREHSLLKLKHEICEIQKKYGLACTVEP